MTVCVLGPLETDGLDLSPRERAVLSALVVRRARAVSRDELADACWGEDPPQTWTQQIQNAIARIRSRLGRDAVRTIGSGYRLGIPDDAVDAVRFEREIASARRHALEGAPDRAVTGLRRALEMWRGDPFPDLPDWPPAQAEAVRLREIRADVEEELLDARLRLGEDATVIPDAERMVRAAPLREHRWATLALANYRAGRQAEASAVLRAARVRFVQDLGIDLGRELSELEIDILRQSPSLDASRPPPLEATGADATCPYPGLSAYDAEDAAVFFGRDDDIDALVARARPGAIVTLVGPSGSGKSSVLRAGVVPRLRGTGRRVIVVDPDAAGLARLRTAADEDAAVIAVDQAEELLALHSDDLRELAALLRPWVDRGGCLVLALRSDFLDRATAIPGIGAALGRDVYALSPLDDDRLRLAITGPAESRGLGIETGLTEVILRDAGDRTGILPAMSHALAATWARRDGATLTISGYEEAGGIAGAIAQSAEQVYRSLGGHGQAACRSLMMRLVERTPEGATVRRRASIETLTSGATRRSVVESLVAARLVTVDHDSVIIAHEAVGSAWPRLDAWLTEDADDARMLRQAESAASAWQAAGRRDDDLLRGARLQEILEWRERTSPELTETEAAHLQASAAAQRDEMRELSERATRERASNRRLRVALVASAILLVAVILASAVAVVRGVEAEAAAEDALIESLTTTTLSPATTLETAALLAAEIHRRWPGDPRAFTALQGILGRADGLVRTVRFADDARVAAAIIPRTRTSLVTIDRPVVGVLGGLDASVQVIDLTTGEVIREFDTDLPPLEPSSAQGREVVVSDDGSTALIVSPVASADSVDGCCASLTAVALRAEGSALGPHALPMGLTDEPVLSRDGAVAYLLLEGSAAPARLDLRSGVLERAADPDPAIEDLDLEQIAVVDGRVYVGARDHLRVYDADSLAPTGEIALPVRRNVSMTSRHLGSDGVDGLLTLSPTWAARIEVPSGEVVWARTDLGCSTPMALQDPTFLCPRADGLWSYSLDTGEVRRMVLQLPSGARTLGWMPGVDEIATLTSEPAVLQRWRPSGEFAVQTAADMRDVACAIAGRQFTASEWARHFGDDEYVETCPAVPGPLG